MPFVILPTNSASGGYEITNSLRFNSGSSDKLTRTTGTPTSQQKFTSSSWCKITTIGAFNHIIQGFYTNATTYFSVAFNQDKIDIINYAGATTARKITTAVYRDVSAWYHVVVSVDTTLATATDRIKIYVNGTQITAFTTDTAPSQNANLLTNATTTAIGVGEGGSIGYYNGYISEIYYIDGQALTPSSFGETDEDTGIWKPKAYTGTYGTNGFYLQFKNSASLGTDSSGNGNTFTVNNLTSIDQTTDTPTNNFCTMNPLFIPTSGTATFSEGNLNLSLNNFDFGLISTMGVSSGKWYWEVKWTADGDFDRLGVKPAISPSQNPVDIGIGWNRLSTSNGMSMLGTSVSGSWGSAFSVGDIIMFALDCDNKALYIGQNGTWRNSGVPTSGASKTGAVDYSAQSTLTSDYLFPSIGKGNAGTTGTQWNFGNPIYSSNSYTDGAGYGNFSYAVPSGYYALNTKNLAQFG